MSKDLVAQRLFAVFLGELDEHLAGLGRDLLAIEQAARAEERAALLDNMFRAAHSLKGAARSVRVPSIEHICHRLEQHFHDLRMGSRPLSQELLRQLFAELDALSAEAARLAGDPPAKAQPMTATVASRGPVAPVAPDTHRGTPQAREPVVRARPEVQAAPTDKMLRISADKVDALLARASELTTLTSMLDGQLAAFDTLRQLARQFQLAAAEGDRASMQQQLLLLGKNIEQQEDGFRKHVSAVLRGSERLDDDAQRLRLVPFAEACEGLDRAVRDLSQNLGKPAELVVEHNNVEIDRAIAQRLRDPLLHLLRNALSHGIEPQDERILRQKPRLGRIVIAAALLGKQVEVTVSDDGGGFDVNRIRARAQAMQLDIDVSERELLRYTFAAGFSTASKVTEVSGRGVGLDAVKSAIEAVHGSVELTSNLHRGSRFSLLLPLTLSKIRCVFVVAGGRPYALPASHVLRVVRFAPDELLVVEGRELLKGPDGLVPLASLSTLLGVSGAPRSNDQVRTALVLQGDERSVALVVDELGVEREITARALPARLASARHVSSATFVERGRIALVLSPHDLCRRALQSPTLRAEATRANVQRPRVLVAEDSATTRAVLKSVLQEAHYDVTTAQDGEQAFMLLQQRPFDILISDVQMPNKDGFELAESVRNDERLARLPIVLMTSLESEADRMRGLRAGASAYLTKGAFDHRTLLETMAALL